MNPSRDQHKTKNHRFSAGHTAHRDKNSAATSLDSLKYAQLFGGVEDPILILDLKFDMLYANPAAVKFLHLSSLNHPQNFRHFLAPATFSQFNAAVKRAVVELKKNRLELEFHGAKVKGLVCEVNISPLAEKRSVSALQITIHDIDQEQQIASLLIEAQKMEALQSFVSGTTKELKNPLLAILKRIENINAKYHGRNFEYVTYKEFNGLINFLQSMHRQIKQCYETAQKLTNLNKKGLKFESDQCQPNAVIREVLQFKEKHLEASDVKLRLRLQEKIPAILLGEIEFNQIITNLIDNSLQAMPAGGVLTISAVYQADHDRVRIDVSDNGVGISPEELPHIFEPFFTTKQRGMDKNAGLGLSIVYSLVKAAHGQIQVKSSLRKGTTVELLFPTARK